MTRVFFKFLHRINQAILPAYSRKPVKKLSALDKIIIYWKYFVAKNSLR